jgi:hypothetical protein
MKSLKMICTTTLLVLVFTIPGHGGEINTPGMTAEPPVVLQPAPNTEDNTGNLQQFNQDSELETSAWTAILLTLSALF